MDVSNKKAPSIRRDVERIAKNNGTPEGTWTPNLLIRSQALYPIELQVHLRSAG